MFEPIAEAAMIASIMPPLNPDGSFVDGDYRIEGDNGSMDGCITDYIRLAYWAFGFIQRINGCQPNDHASPARILHGLLVIERRDLSIL